MKTCVERGHHALEEPVIYTKDGKERRKQACKDCPKVYDEPVGVLFKWTGGK